MNWLNDFYSKQYKWSTEHDVLNSGDLRYDLLDKVLAQNPNGDSTILDLGSGLGQFAITVAKEGFYVTALELTGEGVAFTKEMAKRYGVEDKITVIQGDFYEVELGQTFDFVCYWDGFGIGTDEEQERLLKRISKWLKDDGTVFIDLYTPWYWAKVSGKQMKIGGIERQYGFEAEDCRMTDTWWLNGQPKEKITQYLRCYSPADLKLLLRHTELKLINVSPGGAMDYEKWEYHKEVPLHQAMTFLATIKKSS
ncbi:SAM-dependent methyltransferase [Piscibacillus sp. B03]|uniref:SAM-dependent methyltransferase n=1 Tax=Piscibacillus sp. B03 TaxID=3457430 RepID=UPI003FCCF7F5